MIMTPVAVPSYLDHLAAALLQADDDAAGAIAGLIADAPIASPDDVIAKLLALDWCYDGPSLRPPSTVDQRIIDSLIRAVQPGAPLGR